MTKRLLLSLAAAGFLTANAAPLSPEQALGRVDIKTMTRGFQPQLVYTLNTNQGQPAVYIFNKGEDAGFVVVSADDAAEALLGYSDHGHINPSDIPAPMKWWLREYARQIDYVSSIGAAEALTRGSDTRAAFGDAISPMIMTKWDQGTPYNLQCPEINGVRCVTGCVATAMAQVMRFHKYPVVGIGEVSVTVEGIQEPLTLDLSARNFDWEHMLDSYVEGKYDEKEANAVAYLMKASGYSVDMNYTTNESGAISFNIGKALIENFGYNPHLTYEERDYYNETSWGKMVYAELAARRPVIYGGQSEGGGHQFVCDGYDGQGYFHINWGWGGMSDGYFLLQSLNPADLGIGGGTGGGFSYDQSIIKGVQPGELPENESGLISQSSNITGNTSSTARITLRCQGQGGWWNMTYQTLKLSLGVILENLDNPSAAKQYIAGSQGDYSLANTEFKSMTGVRELTFLFPTDLPDGKYQATVAYKSRSTEDAPWQPVKCPEYYSNSVTVTKSGTSYKIVYPETKNITVLDCELLSALHYGAFTKVKISVKNDTDVELSQTIAPALLKQGEYWFVTDGIPLNLKPGETITRELPLLFNPQESAKAVNEPMSFSMKVLDLNTGKELKFSKSVEMQPASSYEISVSDMQIAGAEKSVDGDVTRFLISNASHFSFSADLKCVSGYFGEALYAAVIDRESNSLLSYQPMSPIVTVSEGESSKVSADIYFDQAVEGESYELSICYLQGNSLYRVTGGTSILTVGTSDVDQLQSDGFSMSFDRQMQCVTIAAPGGLKSAVLTRMDGLATDVTSEAASGSISLQNLSQGIYVVKAIDSRGTTRTLKIAW